MTTQDISFRTRKWFTPEALDANGTLSGGSLLRWIDEEASVRATAAPGGRRSARERGR